MASVEMTPMESAPFNKHAAQPTAPARGRVLCCGTNPAVVACFSLFLCIATVLLVAPSSAVAVPAPGSVPPAGSSLPGSPPPPSGASAAAAAATTAWDDSALTCPGDAGWADYSDPERPTAPRLPATLPPLESPAATELRALRGLFKGLRLNWTQHVGWPDPETTTEDLCAWPWVSDCVGRGDGEEAEAEAKRAGPRVREIWLHDVGAAGTISPLLGDLGALTTLVLQEGTVSGVLPASLSRLTSLERMDLSNNRLVGTEASVAPLAATLTGVVLDSNRLQRLPEGLGCLTGLRNFRAASNDLQGTLPDVFGRLAALESLDVRSRREKTERRERERRERRERERERRERERERERERITKKGGGG